MSTWLRGGWQGIPDWWFANHFSSLALPPPSIHHTTTKATPHTHHCNDFAFIAPPPPAKTYKTTFPTVPKTNWTQLSRPPWNMTLWPRNTKLKKNSEGNNNNKTQQINSEVFQLEMFQKRLILHSKVLIFANGNYGKHQRFFFFVKFLSVKFFLLTTLGGHFLSLNLELTKRPKRRWPLRS